MKFFSCNVLYHLKHYRVSSSLHSPLLSLFSPFFKQNPLSVFKKAYFCKSYVLGCKAMDIKSVTKVIESVLPPELAEKWDKTGLLIKPDTSKQISSIFFTIDLTEAVLEEAISLRTDMVIAYHPPIFSPLPKLLDDNWKDRIVMKCIKNSIAVYSPHTVCDIVNGGVNDWLIRCFDVSDIQAIHHKQDFSDTVSIFEFTLPLDVNVDKFMKSIIDFKIVSLSTYGKSQHVRLSSTVPQAHALKILTSHMEVEFVSIKSAIKTDPSKGVGRIAKLKNPTKLSECIKHVKNYLNMKHIRLSLGVNHSLDTNIEKIAVCAGSGASVLKDIDADLYFTGEMSHHEVLHAAHRNVSVIMVEHTNSERGYLENLIDLLQPHLRSIKMNISKIDKDPISVV